MTQAGGKPDREIAIEENLRQVYRETVDEGVPDRFKQLLDALKHQDQNAGQLK